jgi:hypothetical protein
MATVPATEIPASGLCASVRRRRSTKTSAMATSACGPGKNPPLLNEK